MDTDGQGCHLWDCRRADVASKFREELPAETLTEQQSSTTSHSRGFALFCAEHLPALDSEGSAYADASGTAHYQEMIRDEPEITLSNTRPHAWVEAAPVQSG